MHVRKKPRDFNKLRLSPGISGVKSHCRLPSFQHDQEVGASGILPMGHTLERADFAGKSAENGQTLEGGPIGPFTAEGSWDPSRLARACARVHPGSHVLTSLI